MAGYKIYSGAEKYQAFDGLVSEAKCLEAEAAWLGSTLTCTKKFPTILEIVTKEVLFPSYKDFMAAIKESDYVACDKVAQFYNRELHDLVNSAYDSHFVGDACQKLAKLIRKKYPQDSFVRAQALIYALRFVVATSITNDAMSSLLPEKLTYGEIRELIGVASHVGSHFEGVIPGWVE